MYIRRPVWISELGNVVTVEAVKRIKLDCRTCAMLICSRIRLFGLVRTVHFNEDT